jgi:hypothetical protein
MLLYNTPTNLIVNNVVIIHNIFYTKDIIYIICNTNNTHLGFKVDDIVVGHLHLFTKTLPQQPINLYQLKNTSTKENIKITTILNNTEYYIHLTKNNLIREQKELISIMTLFKSDYNLIPAYIKHYKALGIKYFYFYYNYSYTKFIQLENITEILHSINIDKDITCTFMEWNYDYWLNKRRSIHNAQSPAMTDMYYKSRYLSQYILFNDLDEYVYFEDKDVNKFDKLISKYHGIDVFQFKMYWATYVPKNTINHDNLKISYNDFIESFDIGNFVCIKNQKPKAYLQKSKILLKTNLLGCTVHKEVAALNSDKGTLRIPYKRIIIGGFYHIRNLIEKYRKI